MSEYIVSARKYRPATFSTVVGQRTLTETLKSAIDSKRLAQAYLFCGPRGVGKTSCARIFAKTINCLSPTPDGEACGHCDSCRAIDQGNSFNIIELDAASNNSVDDIRRLTEQVNIPPQVGDYRVFIIDEVHMLTAAAFNAFLKTLEEPPKYVIFILATTEKHKVIPTILSRCQIYDFKRITIQDTIEHLAFVARKEGITAEPAALNVIARKADGAMRDALSIFDQVTASSGGNITYQSTIEHLNVLDYEYYFRLLDAFATGRTTDTLLIYKEIRDKGFDSLFFVNGLASHLRDLMVAVDPSTISLLEVGDDVAQRFVTESRKVPLNWYFSALKILSDCDLNYRTATNKQLTVELALIRLSQLLGPQAPSQEKKSEIKSIPKETAQPSATAKPVPEQPAPAAPKPTPQQPVAPAAKPVAPAAKPMPQQPASAPRTASASKSVHSFRLNGTLAGGEKQNQEAPAAPKQGSNEENGAESKQQTCSLEEAWKEFIDANSDKHIMVNAMRASLPSINPNDANDYVMTVDNPAQMQQCEISLPALAEHLRRRLGNNDIRIRLHLDKNRNTSQSRLLTNEQFLKKAVDQNPVIKDLLESINGEMI